MLQKAVKSLSIWDIRGKRLIHFRRFRLGFARVAAKPRTFSGPTRQRVFADAVPEFRMEGQRWHAAGVAEPRDLEMEKLKRHRRVSSLRRRSVQLWKDRPQETDLTEATSTARGARQAHWKPTDAPAVGMPFRAVRALFENGRPTRRAVRHPPRVPERSAA